MMSCTDSEDWNAKWETQTKSWSIGQTGTGHKVISILLWWKTERRALYIAGGNKDWQNKYKVYSSNI